MDDPSIGRQPDEDIRAENPGTGKPDANGVDDPNNTHIRCR